MGHQGKVLGQAKGKGERGKKALPERWEETKIRMCFH